MKLIQKIITGIFLSGMTMLSTDCSKPFPDDGLFNLLLISNIVNTRIIISKTSLSFREYSPPDTFTVALSAEPRPGSTITISVTSGSPRANVSPAALSFTGGSCPGTGNWCTPQTVTVTPVNNDVVDDDVNSFITLENVWGSLTPYDGLNPADVSLTVLNDDKRIFRTIASSNGNLGGVSGADSSCNTRAGVLGIGSSKAILAASTRRACTTANCSGGISENLDWVLKPNFTYYRPDGTRIMTTNSSAIFPFGTLLAQWDGTLSYDSGGPFPAWYWMGLKTDWINAVDEITFKPFNCQDWTSSNGVDNGGYGDDSKLDGRAIFTFILECNRVLWDTYILCAEQ